MTVQHAKQEIAVTVGRHSRFQARARFTVDGSTVDLAADGYTAEAWVTLPGGTPQGPRACTVEGSDAVYEMAADDLATSSAGGQASDDHTVIVIVAERANPPTRLVSDRLLVRVGDWPGSTSLDA